jgi:hypothetical protein
MLQLIWLILLGVHLGAAALWWWMMPGGFPTSATQFWVNQLAPPLVMAALLAALFTRGKIGQTILPLVLAALIVFWMAFAISARLLFFESFASAWNLPFIAGAVLGGLWVRQFRVHRPPLVAIAAVVVVAALAGWSFPGTQRAPAPSTQPATVPFGNPPSGPSDHKTVKLTKDAQFRPGDARLVMRRDAVVMNVNPLLTFADRSPDRCWVALAPDGRSFATTRTLTARGHDGEVSSFVYKDEDHSLLDVTTRNGVVQLDARSRLGQPVFAHASSYAELAVQGHRKLSVSFSPAPQQRVEVPALGAAARFAYVDGNERFHIAQASQRQRGPFTEVASGRLRRGDPLSVTIYDGDKALFVVTLADWAAQVSTELSPTAGDGLPMNVIELVRGGEPDSAPVLISFALAATTIGRGTQSVGHAAGVYRDRISVSLP